MLKRKLTYYLISLTIIFAALFLAGSVSFILALNNQTTPVSTPTPQISLASSPSSSPSPSLIPTSQSKTTIKPSPTPIPISTPSAVSSATPTSASNQPAPAPQTFQISLTVTREQGGQVIIPTTQVSVPEGVNQCDVLSKALEQGKISQLNMKYNPSLKSYGVYQINGVGKENDVWWVYTVNGQSPAGCSFVKANNGDNIEWRYVGS